MIGVCETKSFIDFHFPNNKFLFLNLFEDAGEMDLYIIIFYLFSFENGILDLIYLKSQEEYDIRGESEPK